MISSLASLQLVFRNTLFFIPRGNLLMYQNLADATFRIQCGQSSGSGFSYRQNDIVVTNYHVIEPYSSGQDITVITEDGSYFVADLLGHSPVDKYDFAILKLKAALPPDRKVIKPKTPNSYSRGQKIIFSGFPHGIHDLLVHEAIISGPVNNHGFYIDGSVNGGNSGGPIVDQQTGELVGIVTQRRFLGGQAIDALNNKLINLHSHCRNLASRGSVSIMGIDFGSFANLMAEGLAAMSHAIQTNANSGIGIGFKIEYMDAEYERLCLKKLI